MSKGIYKYPIPASPEFTLALPRGAMVLDVQDQRGSVVIWALCDLDAPAEPRHFAIVLTGQTVPDDLADRWSYIGTFQTMVVAEQVWIVGHLWEKDWLIPDVDA